MIFLFFPIFFLFFLGWSRKHQEITVGCAKCQEREYAGSGQSCKKCEAGRYSTIASHSKANCVCVPGKFGNNCYDCPKGRFTGPGVYGSVECLRCLPGTFSDTSDSLSGVKCYECVTGKSSLLYGSRTEDDCKTCATVIIVGLICSLIFNTFIDITDFFFSRSFLFCFVSLTTIFQLLVYSEKPINSSTCEDNITLCPIPIGVTGTAHILPSECSAGTYMTDCHIDCSFEDCMQALALRPTAATPGKLCTDCNPGLFTSKKDQYNCINCPSGFAQSDAGKAMCNKCTHSLPKCVGKKVSDTCAVTIGGSNTECTAANADLATCTAANIANTCSVAVSGTNADCAAAITDTATCSAASLSGGGGGISSAGTLTGALFTAFDFSAGNCAPETTNVACSSISAPVNQGTCDPQSIGTCAGGAGEFCTNVANGPEATCIGTIDSASTCTPASANGACSSISAPANQAACDPQSLSATAGTFTGNAFAAYNFLTNADELLYVVVDGSIQIITLNANFGDLATAASGITTAGATIAVDGSFLKITSASTGSTSTITIMASNSGANAIALFGVGASVTGIATNLCTFSTPDGESNPCVWAATNMCTYSSNSQDLIVTVDGGSPQTININTNCDTETNCATALSAKITGASVSEVRVSKTCTVKVGGSNTGCTAANADLATCSAANIANTCTVKDNGQGQPGINTDCSAAIADSATCTAATTSGGSGDTANACIFTDNSIHDCTFLGDNLVITSATVGVTSTVSIITSGSGVNALALFGNSPVVVDGAVTVHNTANDCIFVDNSIHNCMFVDRCKLGMYTAECQPLQTSCNSHTECIACPTGFISNVLTSKCDSCGVGTYNDEIGQTVCKECMAGKYSNAVAVTERESVACKLCESGKASNVIKATSCITCIPGTFASISGQTLCIQCIEGTYIGDAGSLFCRVCQSGQYSNITGSTTCTNCPKGKALMEGSTEAKFHDNAADCIECFPLEYAPEEGLAECSLCPNGDPNKYGQILCTDGLCDEGTFKEIYPSGQFKSSECTLCPIGQFNVQRGRLYDETDVGLNY